MGFTMLGIATLTDFGFNAAVFGMVSHGLITGMLFFLAGSVKERYHTYELSELGGMLVEIPRLGWILGFCAMASLGLPGLAGFWGEFPAILSAYNPAEGLPEETFRTYMVIAAVGTVLAAGYLLWMYQRTAFGVPRGYVWPDEHNGHNGHDGDDEHPSHGDAHGSVSLVHDPNAGAVSIAAGQEPAHGGVAVLEHAGEAEHEHRHDEDLHDVTVFEYLAWTPMLLLIVVLGVYPHLVFRVTDGAVGTLLEGVRAVGGG
jgi:NADH-quinone oxidoreductase subunit M